MRTYDPTTMTPMPGSLITEIVEVLGGMKNGLHRPGVLKDNKDTVIVAVLKKAPMARLRHQHRSFGAPLVVESDHVMPDEVAPVDEGDRLVMPRDVPLAFTHGDRRYAIVHLHEALMRVRGDAVVEVIPWEPSR